MKQLFAFFLLTLFSTASNANYFVCSGPNLYYSSIRHVFGPKPPPGTEIMKNVIVYKGDVLLNESITEIGLSSQNSYSVNLEGSKVTLESTGDANYGSHTFKQMAVLLQVKDEVTIELAREAVICNRTWAEVP